MFKTSPWWANTNKNWLKFEEEVWFEAALWKINWYELDNKNILFGWEKVAEYYKHDRFRIDFLKPMWIIMENIISKNLRPDTAVYVLSWNKVYILEIKYQWWGWSVDEKLQTWKFKKLQYERLLKWTWLEVEFIFILSDFFLNPKYKDVLNFIKAEWCNYFFWELPLYYLWLPEN